jgi:4-carboxymuconolactone decarboxylase
VSYEERRFGPVPMETMTAEQRSLQETIMSGPRGWSGGLRGPFEALLHSPGFTDPFQKLGLYVRYGSTIPTALNEMAILIVARRWTAQFEFAAHRQLAVDAGLDPSHADAIAAGRRPALDADGAAVFEFATQLLDEGNVTDGAFDSVVSRWGKQGAIDLIGVLGYYSLVSFVLNVDRYPPPEGTVPLAAI